METFGTVREKEVEMNNKGHLLIIQALCKGGYVEEAFSMISLLGETPDHYPDLHMYNNLLGACADMKHTDYAKKCLDLMDHAFMGKDERTYMELLKLAVLQQNLSAVHCIWEECTKYYSLNIISLRKFIRSFTRLGDLKSAFGALQQMVALVGRGGFNISKTVQDETSVPSVYENYENAESLAGSTELYTTSNAKMKEVNSAGLHGQDQPERAVQIFSKMRQLKVKPDIRTYELLFSLFGNVNAPYEEGDTSSQIDVAKRTRAIEEDMWRHGIDHSYISIMNLLRALGTEGMVKELIEYLQLAENQFSRRNSSLGTSIYNTVLHSLIDAGESQMAADIFKTMLLCGHQPDAATYTIMIDCCSIVGSFKSAFALLSMMIRDGFYPQVQTYTVLIKILLANEDFDQAFHLLNRGCSEGIQPDAVLFNTFLYVACDKGRIDIIEHLVERMHEEKIQPDASTCAIVFTAYVERGFFTTAMEALQVLSMRMIPDEDIADEEKRKILEDYFVHAEESEEAGNLVSLCTAQKSQPYEQQPCQDDMDQYGTLTNHLQ